jgi:hypothetical protein
LQLRSIGVRHAVSRGVKCGGPRRGHQVGYFARTRRFFVVLVFADLARLAATR